ncbi:hypothetical protein LTR16_002991 [Cryomyces antarcticus]|uniref:Uncharacterized protein n=1 Tax=Cryomyces antarcticus TaxID=329879 RepID=A0ABR0LP99_9PEZI|nr:hypothetical protein LTR16_002991 [Cryomyces antarcticus]
MGLINLRELLQFPVGDNATDTLINGVHFNQTALDYWNYTLYSNNTISNDSKCYLIFDQYQPLMLSNGSWINGTSCYLPYYRIKGRGTAGIVFASLFAASIMFTLINLRKHGRLYLREDKRFRVIGRRWQWYWMCFVAACGMISCITGIDVDRVYLQEIAIVLQSFFFSLMMPGTLAMVWECVRHWGSWQERQICDRDPYLLPQDDRRGRAEFYMPLVFYLFAWMNFFMTIPRSWTNIELQRSPEQQDSLAEPSATDNRFKAGACLAAVAWLVICYSLSHSLYWYKPRSTGLWGRFNAFCHYCPTKIFLVLVVLAIRIAYGIAAAWEWDISIMKYDVQPAWPYGLGYGTTILIIIIFEIYGMVDPNEDLVLIEQRRERGRAIDAELGLVKKPSWWSKMNDQWQTPEQRLKNMMTEVGGGAATGRNITASVEMGSMPVRDRSRSRPPEDPFRDQSPEDNKRTAVARADSVDSQGSALTGRSGITGSTLAEPVKIRSMLDI